MRASLRGATTLVDDCLLTRWQRHRHQRGDGPRMLAPHGRMVFSSPIDDNGFLSFSRRRLDARPGANGCRPRFRRVFLRVALQPGTKPIQCARRMRSSRPRWRILSVTSSAVERLRAEWSSAFLTLDASSKRS